MTSALRGGGGVPSKADIVSNLSKGGCMNLPTGGEGVKKSETFSDVIYGSPLMELLQFQEGIVVAGGYYNGITTMFMPFHG